MMARGSLLNIAGWLLVFAVLAAECMVIGGSLALLVLTPLFGRPLGWFCAGALVGYLYAVVTVLDGRDA
jgi:hypothetical protein